MKQFDIENLNRNTPYELPLDTFEEVQKRVLKGTTQMQQTPVYPLKWMYAAAAIFIFLVGFGFLYNSNSNQVTVGSQDVAVNESEIIPQSTEPILLVDTPVTIKNTPTHNENNNLNLTSATVSNLTIEHDNRSKQNIVKTKSAKTKFVAVQDKVDDVLDGFSPTELASLTNNTEQDVYLDLYN